MPNANAFGRADDPYNLSRFVEAQEADYAQALTEIRSSSSGGLRRPAASTGDGGLRGAGNGPPQASFDPVWEPPAKQAFVRPLSVDESGFRGEHVSRKRTDTAHRPGERHAVCKDSATVDRNAPVPPALLHGPYVASAFRRGDRTTCLFRDCEVIITTWTDGPIPWPRRRALHHRGGSGLLVDREVARAVRTE